MGNDRQENNSNEWYIIYILSDLHGLELMQFLFVRVVPKKEIQAPFSFFFFFNLGWPYVPLVLLSLSLQKIWDTLGKSFDVEPLAGSRKRDLWQRIYKTASLLHKSFSMSWDL